MKEKSVDWNTQQVFDLSKPGIKKISGTILPVVPETSFTVTGA
jgi:hypothetical protein